MAGTSYRAIGSRRSLYGRHGATLPGAPRACAAAKAAGAVTLNYGAFLNTILTFLIVALAIFMLVKAVNRLYRQPAPATPDTRPCPYCTMTVALQATRCPNCTSELAGAGIPSLSPAPAPVRAI